MNHDALFKTLLKTGRLLQVFFEAFLPKILAFIDFGHIEFAGLGQTRPWVAGQYSLNKKIILPNMPLWRVQYL
jgi:hypothetical protein